MTHLSEIGSFRTEVRHRPPRLKPSRSGMAGISTSGSCAKSVMPSRLCARPVARGALAVWRVGSRRNSGDGCLRRALFQGLQDELTPHVRGPHRKPGVTGVTQVGTGPARGRFRPDCVTPPSPPRSGTPRPAGCVYRRRSSRSRAISAVQTGVVVTSAIEAATVVIDRLGSQAAKCAARNSPASSELRRSRGAGRSAPARSRVSSTGSSAAAPAALRQNAIARTGATTSAVSGPDSEMPTTATAMIARSRPPGRCSAQAAGAARSVSWDPDAAARDRHDGALHRRRRRRPAGRRHGAGRARTAGRSSRPAGRRRTTSRRRRAARSRPARRRCRARPSRWPGPRPSAGRRRRPGRRRWTSAASQESTETPSPTPSPSSAALSGTARSTAPGRTAR